MTFKKSYLDEEVIHEVMRQAIRETADEADRKDTFKDVYKDAYISVEDRGFIDEVIRDDDDKKQHAIFVSVPALLLIVAPISGCIMWFTSIPLWINIAILALAGIMGGIFSCLSESRDPLNNCNTFGYIPEALFVMKAI